MQALRKRTTIIALYLSVGLLATACKQTEGNPPFIPGRATATTKPLGPVSITIAWDANIEQAVNNTGGGYFVCYNVDADCDDTNALGLLNVPYVSGVAAPTTTTIPDIKLRAPHVYNIRVRAYSILRPLGGSWGPAMQVTVPR